jgi:uncharacterized damage-inducible protein DinB
MKAYGNIRLYVTILNYFDRYMQPNTYLGGNPMNRIDLLIKGFKQAYDDEGWFAPLGPILEGVSAQQASWRPDEQAANSIWGTLNHLHYYKALLLDRLQGGPGANTVQDNDDTFALNAAPDDENAWREAVARHEAVHRGLLEALAACTDADFDRPLPKQPLGVQMYNIILHDAYHTGQILQLSKLQGSWPARREF